MSDLGVSVGGGLFGGESIPVMESVLSFANQRHAVLLNNVANMDTPGFKAKDVPEADFRRALEQAISSRETSARPLDIPTDFSVRAAPGGGFELATVEGKSGLMRNDGNDVAVDEEMTKLLKNALTVQVFNRLLSSKYRMLGSAISMRVG